MQILNNDLLVAGCKKGDRKIQAQVYKIFSSKMYAVCLRYAYSTAEAEDILQEGFVKVFTRIHLFNNQGSFEGWIRRIMVNTALTAYRRNQRQVPTCELGPIDHAADDTRYHGETDGLYLLHILKDLGDKYRIPFSLFAIDGYSHQEIANKMGISVVQSRVRVCRARTTLRESVSNYQAVLNNRRLGMTA